MPYGYGLTINYHYKAFLHKAIELSKPDNREKDKNISLMETKLVLEYNALTYVVFHCNVYTIHCIFTWVMLVYVHSTNEVLRTKHLTWLKFLVAATLACWDATPLNSFAFFSPLQAVMVTSTTTLQVGSFVMLNCTKLGQEQVRFEDSYLDGRSTRCLKTDCASLLQTVFSYVVSKL